MEYVITQTADTKTEGVSLPASALLLAPQQQMLTIQEGLFSVERRVENQDMFRVHLEVQMLESEFQKLKETDVFGLKQAAAWPNRNPIRLSLTVKPEALMRLLGRLRNVTDTEAILQTQGPDDFPFFLQLAHYQLTKLEQVKQTVEL